MASLILNEVSCTYRTHKGVVCAVQDLSFEVRDGELVVLAGPSGSGKTTTLRLIAGLESLVLGEIWLGSRDIAGIPPRAREVAMVFQDGALYPHLNVLQNLAFGLKVRGTPRTVAAQKARELALTLGLTHLLDRKPAQLSGGEKQRVALGRALIRTPVLFLMDEPFASLDAASRTAMRGEIQSLQRALGTTMLYVTHDQQEAMMMADRIALLLGGRLQQLAPPMEIYDRPANRFVAGFFGSPSMNFWQGELVALHGDMIFRSRDFEVHGLRFPPMIQTGSTEVVMGIRPHEVIVDDSRAIEPGARGAFSGGLVRRVESLGDSLILRITLASGGECTAKLARGRNYVEGQAVRVTFPLQGLHFFECDAVGRSLRTA